MYVKGRRKAWRRIMRVEKEGDEGIGGEGIL
jgi:hypothetical protein